MKHRRGLIQMPNLKQGRFAPLDQESRAKLNQAHKLMEEGKYNEAAPIFNQLAEMTLSKGMIRRAPFLLYKTSRAYFLSGHVLEGKEYLLKCFNLLLEGRRWLILQSMVYRTIHELEQMNLIDVAQEIKNWQSRAFTKDTRKITGNIVEVENKQVKSKLPPKCPYCGATVLPNEYDWIDTSTIECAYCGSIIQVR